ncbi:MAG: hypothetical protein UV48_C0016G0002 [Candidatus Azambacteria bacterium GW2011_GWA2_42_9]|uniref:Uncharacterized protein n=3 Tax=Candidatus Azamiibacteriota TaxID=1752741 RepID=A0A0G1C6A7_9BACT|nr:MAG: hypothetical protein UV07_C0024G0002 [Candidatus Azambacteria bacterium GW2011_GWB1_42_17]KKS45153.1 MAG: hypothetical protein UV10_C0032G0004 [Candidatus Azambacteria bacterium GW2011_GWA1_42_19]KKS75211.1 MAG: hypothetical protein UV48_C0016G0002 [Candidatus Azambacteria bacterium GW2011_GWA2_42_9]
MKYGELNLGQIEAIANKLGGMEGVQRFLSGELVVKVVEKSFAIWKTIVLGRNTSPGEYRNALKANGCHIGDYADQILNKVKVSETETQLDLIVMTVAELGFKKGAIRKQIYDRAIELGLELCPAEVGPALRLRYPDQPYGEWLRISMDPITDSDGDPGVFGVDRDGDERWLYCDFGSPDGFWDAGSRWVFVVPRK